MTICPKGKQNGFSLIEAVVTMAIAAIVLSIGIPSFQSFIQNNRKTTAVGELFSSLQLARSTAVSRRVPVTICKSSDGATCSTGGGSGDWTQGWMIFTNVDGDTTLDAGDGDTLIRVHEALPGSGISLIGNTNVVNRVSFSPQGIARGFNGTITYCDSRGASDASALVISIGGQVRHATDTDSSGIVDVTSGGVTTDVTCPAA